MCVDHNDLAAGHLPDHPGRIAEQKNIAARALNGKVFVQGTDNRSVSLRDDFVLGLLGNGSAGGDGGDASMAAGLQLAVDLVAMQIGSGFVARHHPFGEHLHDVVVVLPREIAVGIGPPAKVI